jgi:hypothetical protein
MQRFWRKIDREGPWPEKGTMAEGTGRCWVWLDSPMKIRYGRLNTPGGNVYAHRIMYEHAHGSIPDGYEIDHLCGMKNCVAPAHLEAVPHIVNVQRSWDLRRYRTALGLDPRVNFIPRNWRSDPAFMAQSARKRRGRSTGSPERDER